MSNTKDTLDYKPLDVLKLYPALVHLEIKLQDIEVTAITLAMEEYANQQNASLKSDLQKQKEEIEQLRAMIKKLLPLLTMTDCTIKNPA